MKNNETGEFELVVGNRQLLSGFFLVVLLFAVAFAMGYVVGQNSRQSAKGQTEAAATSPVPVESRPQAASPAPVAAPPAQTADSTPPKPAETAPQVSTQPARDPQQPAPVPAPPAAEGAPGTYWQVLATANQTSAQAMLKTLQDKGFPASLGPGPNNWTRVLVGPYTDTAAMGKAKTQLENAGFQPVKH